MGTVLVQALAIASGGMVSVGSILIVLLLLSTKHGPRNAKAYTGGYILAYACIGMVTFIVGQKVTVSGGGGGSYIGSILYALMGCLFLFFAVKRWRSPASKDDGPPKFLQKLHAFEPKKSFTFGLMISCLNFKNLAIFLSAVSTLSAVRMSLLEGGLSVVLITIVFCSTLILPIGIYYLIPERSEELLGKMKRGLEEHSRMLSIVILTLFGVLFLLKGTRGLYSLLS